MPNIEATPGVFSQKPPLQPLPSPTPANKTLLRKADTAAISYRAEREAEGGKKHSDGLQAREEEGTGNHTERDGEKQRIVMAHRAEREGLKRGTVRWTERD